MVKVALLIGISEFADAALAPLPAALRDINAVQAVLNDAERGGFDEVRLLDNPERQPMEEAIDALFRDRHFQAEPRNKAYRKMLIANHSI